MTTSPLLALAQSAGIATHWKDAFGHAQEVGAESLQAILKALRFSSSTDVDCQESIEAIHAGRSHAPLPPLLTAWTNQPIALKTTSLQESASYRLTLEDGSEISGRLIRRNDGAFGLAPLSQPGYHRFECGEDSTTLAVAPRKSFGVHDAVKRAGSTGSAMAWGLSAQLYSLRRSHDGGLADFTALQQLAEAAGAQGASALATSPVHAMFSAEPGRFSPYGPSSRLFLNALHVDPARAAGDDALKAALATLPDGEKRWTDLERGNLVNWPAAGQLRLDVLRRIFAQFRRGPAESPRMQAFAAFCRRGGQQLEDHARFEAVDGWLHRAQPGLHSDWRHWPDQFCNPRSHAVAEFSKSNREEVTFHQFLQWLAAAGCEAAQASAKAAGMPIGVVTDLAVGADPGGSQAWGLQSAMLEGLTVGAPPDLLSSQGQNWGLGALSPRALAEQGFGPWLDMLRANMRYSGGIRIDHVLGMARLWLVPEGESASRGAYVSYPFEDLLRLTALESVRHGAVVIGEDMGTVPEGFSARLADAGVLGIRALWFQRDGTEFLQPGAWPADAMATTSTHDLATLAGWWAGRDIDWRERLNLFAPDSPASVQRQEREADKRELWKAMQEADAALPDALPASAPVADMLAFTGRTPSPLVMVPLEDLLGIVEQPNLPGTVETHPNWQQRLPRDAVDMLGAKEISGRLHGLQAARGAALAPTFKAPQQKATSP